MGIGRKGYFIKFKLFFSFKGQEFDKKNSNATPMPVPPHPFLSVQTLIPASIT